MGDDSRVNERLLPTPQGGDLSVTDFGGDGPDVLFMHHIGFGPLQWQRTIDALQGRVRAIAPALRGHGRSTAAPLRGAAGYADVLLVAQELELRRPVIVAAGTLSAAYAIAAAITEPDRFAGIVTINGTFSKSIEQARASVELVTSSEMRQYIRDRFHVDETCATQQELAEHVSSKRAALHSDWAIPEDIDLLDEIIAGLRIVPGGMSTSPTTDTVQTLYSFDFGAPYFPDRRLYDASPVPLYVIQGTESWDDHGDSLEFEIARSTPPIEVIDLEAGQFPMYTHADQLAEHVLRTLALV